MAASVPISDIYMWPVLAIAPDGSGYVPGAIAAGIMYYMIGGLPFQGQSMTLLAQGYLAGGVGFYAYETMYGGAGQRYAAGSVAEAVPRGNQMY